MKKSSVKVVNNEIVKKFSLFSPFFIREKLVYSSGKGLTTLGLLNSGCNFIKMEFIPQNNQNYTHENFHYKLTEFGLMNSPLINFTYFLGYYNLVIYLSLTIPFSIIIELLKKRIDYSEFVFLLKISCFNLANQNIPKILVHNDLRTYKTNNYLVKNNDVFFIDFESAKYERYTFLYDILLLNYDDNKRVFDLIDIEEYIKLLITRLRFSYKKTTLRTVIIRSLIKVSIRYLRNNSKTLLNWIASDGNLEEFVDIVSGFFSQESSKITTSHNRFYRINNNYINQYKD
jgi:hypothetical protein